jgi:hypothetical protein
VVEVVLLFVNVLAAVVPGSSGSENEGVVIDIGCERSMRKYTTSDLDPLTPDANCWVAIVVLKDDMMF